MSAATQQAAESNPFSTRFTRPGTLAYVFPSGQNGASLVARLAASGWRGQIVGPHGSGKSTLLAALAEPLACAGRRSHRVVLRDRQRRLPRRWRSDARQAGANLLVIDGYEQLSVASRAWARLVCTIYGWGMLVTAHQDVGLPTLAMTSTSARLAHLLVDRLTQASPRRLRQGAVDESFAAAGGNVREMLFDLYDRWETDGPRNADN